MSDSRRETAEVSARCRWRARSAVTLLLVAAWASSAAGAAGRGDTSAARSPRRVLVISSYGTDFPLFNQLVSILRSGLTVGWQEPFDVYEVALEHARVDDEERMAHFRAYVRGLAEARRFDLVVVLGGPAVRLLQSRRTELFDDSPVLYAAYDVRLLDASKLGPREAAVPNNDDLPAAVEVLLQVMPGVENLAVIVGSSPIERFWRAELGLRLQRFEPRVRLLWLDGMSLEELRGRVATLPPRTAVFFVLLLVDGAGVPHSQGRVLTALRQSSNAPLFGFFDNQLGQGVVGGRMLAVGETGERIAEAASRVLRGESPASVRYPPQEPETLIFDARELERWGIPESRLPPGSQVLYRIPSPWTVYRWPILGGIVLIGLQAALIAGLVVHRARRHVAEQEVRALHGRLLTTYEQERRRLARELHDDVTQRLARLAIDGAQVARLGATPAGAETLAHMRGELARLGHDVHELSRRLHPSILDDLGLAEAVRSEAERLARKGAVAVDLRLDGAPEKVSGEIGLCLFRVAQEALHNVEQHAQATRVEVALGSIDGGVELSVRDDGTGFDPETRRARRGLGQISMRERLHLVGGRLSIESAVGKGTTVRAWAPLPEGPR